MEASFCKKVVLVTGAGRGIGFAIAKRLHSYGAEVYAIDIVKENLDALMEQCPSIKTINVSLADWEATKSAVEKIDEIDYVVNNAGVLPPLNSFLNIPKEVFDQTFAVNLMAPINIGQIAGKKMKAKGRGGSIVNVSSIGAFRAIPMISPYNISKAGLNMVTMCMASELGPTIRVNAVNPSTVTTQMTKAFMESTDVTEDVLKAHKERHPMKKYGEIEDVVDAVVFLLSECSSHITGHCLPVDGGFLCM